MENQGAKLGWLKRPWHTDWAFWLMMAGWGIVTLPQMLRLGRESSPALAPSLVNLVTGLAISAGIAWGLFGLAPLVIRREIWRRRVTSSFIPDSEAASYRFTGPRGLGVWAAWGMLLLALLCWLSGRSDISSTTTSSSATSSSSEDPAIAVPAEGAGPLTSSELRALEEALPTPPSPSELAGLIRESASPTPNSEEEVFSALDSIVGYLNEYFGVKASPINPTSSLGEANGYVAAIQSYNAQLSDALDALSEADGSADATSVRAFSDALVPWTTSLRARYRDWTDCESEILSVEIDRCRDRVLDRWDSKLSESQSGMKRALANLARS